MTERPDELLTGHIPPRVQPEATSYGAVAQNEAPAPPEALARALPWFGPAWFAGVLIFYALQLLGWLAVLRLRRTGVCRARDPWQARVRQLAAKARLSKPVTLMESALAETPVVIGHLRPIILMPAGLLAKMPACQLEAILLHELAHIRRHDYLVNLAQRCVEGLFFYHPAAWWMSRLIRTEREHCCDDLVVEVCGDARSRWRWPPWRVAAHSGRRPLLPRREEV